MKHYFWKQPTSTLKVESDHINGYIRVFRKGKLIFSRENLSPETIEIVEQLFLNNVTKTNHDTSNYIR